MSIFLYSFYDVILFSQENLLFIFIAIRKCDSFHITWRLWMGKKQQEKKYNKFEGKGIFIKLNSNILQFFFCVCLLIDSDRHTKVFFRFLCWENVTKREKNFRFHFFLLLYEWHNTSVYYTFAVFFFHGVATKSNFHIDKYFKAFRYSVTKLNSKYSHRKIKDGVMFQKRKRKKRKLRNIEGNILKILYIC